MIEAKQGHHRDSKMYSQLKILSQCFQIPVLNFKNYIFSLQQDVEKWNFYKLSQEVELHQPLNVKFASMKETWSNLLVTVLVPLVWSMPLVWKHGCPQVTHGSANFASMTLMFISGTEHFQRFVINCTMNPKGFNYIFFPFFQWIKGLNGQDRLFCYLLFTLLLLFAFVIFIVFHFNEEKPSGILLVLAFLILVVYTLYETGERYQ